MSFKVEHPSPSIIEMGNRFFKKEKLEETLVFLFYFIDFYRKGKEKEEIEA